MQPVLLNALLTILRAWTPAFSQPRSAERAVEQALGSLLSLGRRTLSRALWALGRQHLDWSADYKLHSRANWKAMERGLASSTSSRSSTRSTCTEVR